MTRFLGLLEPDMDSLPSKDQERASRDLPDAVKLSNLGWWAGPSDLPADGTALLVLIAPYSQYDLALLDVLDEGASSSTAPLGTTPVPIHVANLQGYRTVEQLTKDVPLIEGAPLQTPVAAVWEGGMFRKTAAGKPGRDLVADTLGISRDEFHRRVIARVPR